MYKIFDLCVASNVPLPELPTCEDHPNIEFRIVVGSAEPDTIDIRWLHHWRTPDGEIFTSCGMGEQGFLLRFPEIADFHISSDQRKIECTADSGIAPQTIRHLLIDQVIPRLLGHQGSLVVHGSAVVMGGQAIAFLGESGLGKSTLAAYLNNHGCPLLTDDCFKISGIGTPAIMVIPNYQGVRLFEDSAYQLASSAPRTEVAHYTSKQRVVMETGEGARYWPLRAVFFLAKRSGRDETDQVIDIAPVTGLKRIMKLVQCSFGLYGGTNNELPNHFRKQGALSNSSVQFLELDFPRRYDQLPLIHQTILDGLRKKA